MSAGAGHQDSEGQAQEGRRAGADTCQVLLTVKSCHVVKYYSVQALVSSLFSSTEVGGQVLGWVEAVAAR